MSVNLSFQLPSVSVHHQSHWSLDADCISINGELRAKSSDKINRVELNRIFTNAKGDQIAELDYLFIERALLDTEINDQIKERFESFGGDGSPSFTFPSEMSCSYVGRHHFNITKGQIVKTYGQLTMNTGVQKSIQIMSMMPTQLTLPKPKPTMSAEERWGFLKEQSESQVQLNGNNDKPKLPNKLIPQKQTVALINTPQQITKEPLKLTPSSSLPFLGWNSGVCFVVGTMETPSYEQSLAILKKTFGEDTNTGTEIIVGEILGNNDLKYQLKGTIDITMLQTPEVDKQTSELHVCSCVLCSSEETEKPSNVQSINIKAVIPFEANRIYWLTGHDSKGWGGEEEDPLHRWRVLQEEREKQKKDQD